MNLIGWTVQHMSIRTLLNPCFINIDGDSFDAMISEPVGNWITVTYDKQSVRIHLDYITTIPASETVFYFDHSAPDGKSGCLIIPKLGSSEEED